ncbi:phosphatase [Nocardia higoensis]|uniref:Phosphatase n=1 Tax=Nocardia higoensis TaxID=228599 RepID=A0ABS0D613_9NOCA|nr:PP2C family serine/threonine-protein phosphatase [Nocardia higoensis]MBF6353540.1 phosphatase [Nocardia higoensis]
MNRDLPRDPAEAPTMPIESPAPPERSSTAESPTVEITREAAAPTVEIRTERTVRGTGPRCPDCGAENHTGTAICPSCGADLTGKRVALPLADAPADRFEADLGAVCLVTDRGISHARNEDAVAAAVMEGEHGPHTTVMVVCDGVSTSSDPQAASGSAVRAGVQACLRALEQGQPATEAALAGLVAASDAVRAIPNEERNAPSCTYVSAIVRGAGGGAVDVTVANVGDSRAYWLAAEPIGEDPTYLPSQRLTVDDSWAQALVDAGAMDEQAAMNDPRAHTLLRWLGADTDERPWSDRAVRTFRARTSGRLLLCSDGLWNYRPDADQLAALAAADDPMTAARDLADFAVRSGGNDNITVALAPIS